MADLKRGDRCVDRFGSTGTVTARWEGGNGDIPSVSVEFDNGTAVEKRVTDVSFIAGPRPMTTTCQGRTYVICGHPVRGGAYCGHEGSSSACPTHGVQI